MPRGQVGRGNETSTSAGRANATAPGPAARPPRPDAPRPDRPRGTTGFGGSTSDGDGFRPERVVPRNDADPKGLVPFGRTVATTGAVLLLLGLAFGSYPYLLMAAFLLGAAFYARGLAVPTLRVRRHLPAADVRAGEPVDVTLDVQNGGATAALSLHDAVPDAFSLDAGRNFDAAWLEEGRAARLTYRLRAPRRGAHVLGPLRATVYDPLFLQSATVAEAGERTDLLVHPRTPPTPRIKGGSAWGRTQLPGGDRAVRGIQTNDFRELRPYARGDPLKAVNWKATARLSREDDLHLVVNDYEVEGKKVVWIFVDASPYTVGGTTSASQFDELASGCLSVAGHYLDLGHRVGVTLFGCGPARILYADAGDLQERRIAAALAAAEPGEPGDDVGRAVEATKGFLAREKPLVFVFTLPGRDPGLARSLLAARALASTGRRPAPVVAVFPTQDDDGSLAARVVALHEKAQLKGLERRGVTILRYHPTKRPLAAMLAKGVLR